MRNDNSKIKYSVKGVLARLTGQSDSSDSELPVWKNHEKKLRQWKNQAGGSRVRVYFAININDVCFGYADLFSDLDHFSDGSDRTCFFS